MRTTYGTSALAIALALAGAACESASDITDPCNPLGGEGCLLPWPSMAYVEEDATSETGFRLALPREGMPVNADGIVVEPDRLNRWDGFSAIGPLLAMFPNGVSSDGLPSWKNPDESLAADSPIVLLEVATGERVPFFAEVDQNQSDVTKRALIIRPLARLKTKSRYAVGIRDTVKAADGSAIAPSPGFAALRDGGSYNHPRFAAIREGAAAMFGALATAGVPKSELVLAWDFVTVSDEYLRADLTTMRSTALTAIGEAGANLSFTTEPQPNLPSTYKRFLGTFKSPDFLTDGEEPASIIRRDPVTNLPVADGLRDAQFAAIIPKCIETMPLPRPTIIFGHGLFGSAEGYLGDDFVLQLAQDYCLVIIAGDWIGLTERQFPLVPLVVNDINRAPQVTEKLAQSVVDYIALESVARGPMSTAPDFQYMGMPVIDPTRTFYIGGSLGGIMGNTLMAYDPNFERGVLAVPGGNWSMLLERSAAWGLLMGAAKGAYEDPTVYQLNLAFGLGMGLEPYDPMTTAAHVIKDPLFGQQPKKILMWYAIGDSLVTNISTEMVAREMGIELVGPAVKPVWGMTPRTEPLESGITVYDEHRTPAPLDSNVPPLEDNGTHSGINRKGAPLRQVEQFLLEPKQVVNECKVDLVSAPCDCATGACN